jgi:prepilin-type processing-associated H-X9-DG protein
METDLCIHTHGTRSNFAFMDGGIDHGAFSGGEGEKEGGYATKTKGGRNRAGNGQNRIAYICTSSRDEKILKPPKQI